MPVLELLLDGHPAYIRSSQKTVLTSRGIVDGMVFLASERASQLPNVYLQGRSVSTERDIELVGCTDDPGVFALYQAMCDAIRTDRWHESVPHPHDEGGPHAQRPDLHD